MSPALPPPGASAPQRAARLGSAWLQATLALLCGAVTVASLRCGPGQLPSLSNGLANTSSAAERWRPPLRLQRRRVHLSDDGTLIWRRGAPAAAREALQGRVADARQGGELSLLTLAGTREVLPADVYLDLRATLELAPDAPPHPPAAPVLLVRVRWPGARGGARLLVIGAELPVPFDATTSEMADALALSTGRAVLLGPPETARQALSGARELARSLDGLAVYGPRQGDASAEAPGEALYRWATAYSGASLRLAAVGVAGPGGGRVHTEAFVSAPEVDGLSAALRARRTVAVRGLPGLQLDLAPVGQVVQSSEVDLRLELGRPVAVVELWREQQRVRVYRGVRGVEFHERISANTAYTFRVVDRDGSAMTSAVWYEPVPAGAAELEVDASSLGWEEGRARAVVRNRGQAVARFVDLHLSDGAVDWGSGTSLGSVEIDSIGPGRSVSVELPIAAMPDVLTARLRSAIPGRPLADLQPRNDRAWRALHGPALLQWERVETIAQRRSQRRVERGGAGRVR